ncbi:MAG TPA: hypothetical protein PKE06_20575 [Flavilitoribacter sp.]|nr:hypothetical protein [Flavilitoribacter sp.]
MPKPIDTERAFANLRRMPVPVPFAAVERWVLEAEIKPLGLVRRMVQWLGVGVGRN